MMKTHPIRPDRPSLLALAGLVICALVALGIAGCDEGGVEGDPCSTDEDCTEGLICAQGLCEDPASGACSTSSQCPLGQACTDGTCADAPCSADNPCALGETCNDGMCESGGEPVVTADVGTVSVTDDGSDELTVDVPEGTPSFALVVEGAGTNLVVANRVETPSGTVVFDFFEDINTNRTDATDGVYTLLVPTNPEVQVEPGRWRVSLLGDASYDANATAVVKTEPASGPTLDLNLFFVGVDGLDSTTAQSDMDFQTMLDNVASVYADAGITVGDVSYIDITGADADTFRVIDSSNSVGDELFQMFELSSDRSNRAVNLFFVADIVGEEGFVLRGLSGGVPGPPGIHGTTSSGVAVNMADWIASEGDAMARAEARSLTELVIAHETGHYLGLFHTTERNGQSLDADGITGEDPLSDTPTCPDSADSSGNGLLSAEECSGADGGNLMFWSPLPGSRALTAQQGDILRRNPVIQ